MAINHYLSDLPLPPALLGLADEELDIRLIEALLPHDSRAFAHSEPSLTVAYYEHGSGWRQFADTAPLAFRDGCGCLYHASVALEGEGFLPAGERLRGVNVSFSVDTLARLGIGEKLLEASGPWERANSSDGQAHLLQFPAPQPLRRIGLEMLNCRLPGIARDLFLRGKALEMLAETLDHLQSHGQPRALGGRDMARLRCAHRLLTENLDRAWTLESLADEAQLSLRKLKEGFRQLHGKGVYALLQDLRMQQAAWRLADGQRVAEVALAVGYSNPSHFAKVFRRHHGMAPSEYGRTAPAGRS
ncbi:AraC family transcriptional regulator [Stutzerimonas kirkiae]|uniref:AraC family transcriptional regulator n=1 Tax=Stutzerimonas kirkiae TaxID=2211392 RepID=A0A4Q9RFB3_9GAMM|nr:AraC family transcriptional regulator [Stutzerimonas kirkiae]TBU99173.1 AraC family transcriptional regulator [Stutzerimonas kirkiae]TBV06367.1 AraC family transcriptional regulator [Stutzerimonas kirkiae]